MQYKYAIRLKENGIYKRSDINVQFILYLFLLPLLTLYYQIDIHVRIEGYMQMILYKSTNTLDVMSRHDTWFMCSDIISLIFYMRYNITFSENVYIRKIEKRNAQNAQRNRLIGWWKRANNYKWAKGKSGTITMKNFHYKDHSGTYLKKEKKAI